MCRNCERFILIYRWNACNAETAMDAFNKKHEFCIIGCRDLVYKCLGSHVWMKSHQWDSGIPAAFRGKRSLKLHSTIVMTCACCFAVLGQRISSAYLQVLQPAVVERYVLLRHSRSAFIWATTALQISQEDLKPSPWNVKQTPETCLQAVSFWCWHHHHLAPHLTHAPDIHIAGECG